MTSDGPRPAAAGAPSGSRPDRLVWPLLALNGLVVAYNVTTFVRRLQRPHAVASTDFTSYWTAWWMILHGQARALYDAAAQTIAQTTVMGGTPFDGGLMAFLYPPHAAMVGLPLGMVADGLGEGAAFAVWTVANLALAVRLALLAAGELGARGALRWLVLLWTFAFFPVLSNLVLGQLSLAMAVAAFELYRAVRAGRPTTAAVCLVLLSIKPQLVPALTIWLVARRQWTALLYAAVLGAGLIAASAIAFGLKVWPAYLGHVHGLERFFGPGPAEIMPNLRGTLLRLLGAGSQAVDPIAYAVWACALGALAVWLVRRRSDPRDSYAVTLAIALVANPHLFHQDLALAAVAFALRLASLRAHGANWRPFAGFVLAWPPLYLLARLADLTATPAAPGRVPVDPVLLGQLALLALLLRPVVAGTTRDHETPPSGPGSAPSSGGSSTGYPGLIAG